MVSSRDVVYLERINKRQELTYNTTLCQVVLDASTETTFTLSFLKSFFAVFVDFP